MTPSVVLAPAHAPQPCPSTTPDHAPLPWPYLAPAYAPALPLPLNHAPELPMPLNYAPALPLPFDHTSALPLPISLNFDSALPLPMLLNLAPALPLPTPLNYAPALPLPLPMPLNHVPRLRLPINVNCFLSAHNAKPFHCRTTVRKIRRREVQCLEPFCTTQLMFEFNLYLCCVCLNHFYLTRKRKKRQLKQTIVVRRDKKWRNHSISLGLNSILW